MSASTSFFLRVASHARGDLRNAILTASAAAFACRSSGGSVGRGHTHTQSQPLDAGKNAASQPSAPTFTCATTARAAAANSERREPYIFPAQQLKAFLSGARNAAGEAWLHQRPTPLVAGSGLKIESPSRLTGSHNCPHT